MDLPGDKHKSNPKNVTHEAFIKSLQSQRRVLGRVIKNEEQLKEIVDQLVEIGASINEQGEIFDSHGIRLRKLDYKVAGLQKRVSKVEKRKPRRGPRGKTGKRGPAGRDGLDGSDGVPGSPGAQGAPGAAGAQGAQGAPAAGANGIVRQVVSAKGPSSQTSYNSGTWTTIVSQSITVSSSSNRVLVSVKAGFYGGSEGSAYNGGKLLRGSSNIWEVTSIWGRVNAGSGFKASIDGPTLIDNPGSGSHTYYWQTRQHNASGSDVVVSADGNSITLTEFTP